jgi:uncharacterized membrane protein
MISEQVQLALITASFPTIGIGITAYFQYKASKKADIKLDEIHTLTNSAATKAEEKITSLHQEISYLKEIITKSK